jgi:hypothetical protein
MTNLTQNTINFRYAQAQARRLAKLEAENLKLRELIERLRLYILAKARDEDKRWTPVTEEEQKIILNNT